MTTNIVSFVNARYKKDKSRAMKSVTSFITDTITQKHLWYLVLATRHAFRKKMLPTSSVQEIVNFLSERYSVKASGIEYAHAFTCSNEVVCRGNIGLVTLTSDNKPTKERTELKLVSRHWFHMNILQKIQGAADNGLMEYSDALGLITCATEHYPEIKLNR